MPRPRRAVIGGAMLACLLLGKASAQGVAIPATLSVGLFAGLSDPTGQLKAQLQRGYNAGALLQVRTQIEWLSLRADAMYQRFDDESVANSGGGAGAATRRFTSRIYSVTIDAVARVGARRSLLAPTLIAGIGAYDFFGENSSAGPNQRQVAMNAGLGLELSVRRFVLSGELRYHAAAPARVMPLTVGLRF